MEWKTLVVETTAEQLDQLETLFWAEGAVSVTVADAEDNPIFEPGPGEIPVWDQVIASALFNADVDVERVRQTLTNKQFTLLYVEELGDRVWEREWLIRFKPMLFGKRLWVCPTGHEVNAEDAVVMDLDPGLAFGTGTHATTMMCLKWLDGADQEGRSVVDYGAGSGILGIAALLLGAKQVIAVDNDPQALVASRANAERNRVESSLSTCLPDDFQREGKTFDLVIANILAQPLIELSGLLTGLMKLDGDLVLSGIMAKQSQMVKNAYDLDLISEQEDDGWVCLHFQHRPRRESD